MLAKELTRKETLPERRRGERFGRSEMMLFYRREDREPRGRRHWLKITQPAPDRAGTRPPSAESCQGVEAGGVLRNVRWRLG